LLFFRKRSINSIVLGFCLAAPLSANAVVSIIPASSQSGGELKNVYQTTSGVVAYYGVQTDLASAASDGNVFDSGFMLMDVRTGQPTDTTRSSAFWFDVHSSTATGANGTLIVTISVADKPIPIAAAGGSVCSDINCQTNNGPLGTAYYLAAKYTQGATLRIGIYPKDICATLNSDGNGCTGDGKVNASAGRAAHMPLKIEFKTTDATGTTTTVVDSLSTFALHMQVDKPAIGCPSKASVYFPGDEEILLNSAGFYNTKGGSPAPAPATAIYVVADENKNRTTIDDSISGFGLNQNVKFIPIGDVNARVGGFINTTTGDDHQYAVSFVLRDAAGMLASPTSVAEQQACRLDGVQTSNIQGFLSKSKCFVATAAFRSIDAGPVELLRSFRDRVLQKFGIGRTFISWYYSWSSKSAEWLMQNPAFRAPVLVTLIPFQILAWMAVHSFVFLISALLALFPIALVLRSRIWERSR